MVQEISRGNGRGRLPFYICSSRSFIDQVASTPYLHSRPFRPLPSYLLLSSLPSENMSLVDRRENRVTGCQVSLSLPNVCTVLPTTLPYPVPGLTRTKTLPARPPVYVVTYRGTVSTLCQNLTTYP
jgi:hypothetical protein